jgi:hypothetical protein
MQIRLLFIRTRLHNTHIHPFCCILSTLHICYITSTLGYISFSLGYISSTLQASHTHWATPHPPQAPYHPHYRHLIHIRLHLIYTPQTSQSHFATSHPHLRHLNNTWLHFIHTSGISITLGYISFTPQASH